VGILGMEQHKNNKEHLCETCFFKTYEGSGMCSVVGVNIYAFYIPDCWSWKDGITLKGKCDEIEEED
jgi:hypothetical protein